jgi:hypothetical protein
MAIHRVRVIGGEGKWAYWIDPVAGQVVADRLCNDLAGNFAGQLAEEAHGPGPAELHTGGFSKERTASVFIAESNDE